MALKVRRNDDFFQKWYLVASGGLDIRVSSTSFQKNNIDWPQQPPTERVSDSDEFEPSWKIVSLARLVTLSIQLKIDRKRADILISFLWISSKHFNRIGLKMIRLCIKIIVFNSAQNPFSSAPLLKFQRKIITKGQLISKPIDGLLTSPKKRTGDCVSLTFLLFTANRSHWSVRFLEESTARQSAFRFYLTFSIRYQWEIGFLMIHSTKRGQ